MPVLFRSPAVTRQRLNPMSWPARGRRWAVGGFVAIAIVGCAGTDTVSTGSNQSQLVTSQGANDRLNTATPDALALRGDLTPAESGSVSLGTVVAAPAGEPADNGSDGAPSSPAAPSTAAPATAAPPTIASPSAVLTSSSTPSSSTPSSSTPSSPSGPTPSPDPAAHDPPESSAPVAASSAPSTVTLPPATDSPEGLSQGEARSYGLIGELRASLGADPLVRDPELDSLARDWSRHMADTGDFNHSDSPYGENIAFTSNTRLTASEAAEVFHRLWVESEVHYQNMTGTYIRIGIGLYRTERGWYGTHVFAY